MNCIRYSKSMKKPLKTVEKYPEKWYYSSVGVVLFYTSEEKNDV